MPRSRYVSPSVSADVGAREAPSYWLAQDDLDLQPPSRLPSKVEVVVIGGGIMGTSIAYWLARSGVEVLLLEARSLASGATGRNAGLMLAGSAPIEDPTLVRAVARDEAIDANLATPGHLALASSPEVWERICREAVQRAGATAPVQALDHAACEDLLGLRISDRLLGGRWLPSGGTIDPVRFTYGLAAAAQRHGATIATRTRGSSVASFAIGDRIHVGTTRGEVRSRHVVFACGIHLRDFAPSFRDFVTPARGQVMSTRPLPPLFGVGLAIDWGTVYWRQAPDGVVVLGGYRNLDPERETGTDEILNVRIQDALTRFLPETFPDLPPIHVCQRWAGIMDYPRDGRPLIGPLAGGKNQWVIAGFGGHGMPGALGAGHALAEAITTGRVPPILEPFDPRRFA